MVYLLHIFLGITFFLIVHIELNFLQSTYIFSNMPLGNASLLCCVFDHSYHCFALQLQDCIEAQHLIVEPCNFNVARHTYSQKQSYAMPVASAYVAEICLSTVGVSTCC